MSCVTQSGEGLVNPSEYMYVIYIISYRLTLVEGRIAEMVEDLKYECESYLLL